MVRARRKIGDCPLEGYNTWSGLVHRRVTVQGAIHGKIKVPKIQIAKTGVPLAPRVVVVLVPDKELQRLQQKISFNLKLMPKVKLTGVGDNT